MDLSEIYGEELFNIDISKHLEKNSEGEYQEIGCSLMLRNLVKKTNYRNVRQNYSPSIVLRVK